MMIIRILLILIAAYLLLLGAVRVIAAAQISRRAEGASLVAALTPEGNHHMRARMYADAARAHAEAANAWLAAAVPWPFLAAALLALQLVTE